ncbi:MAG TPA: hypothetical protein VMT16_04250 [Thermoanaerobaculia bacterium]|nr:hypothetical protein [Thermoanaerobaculia bacterium]
MRTLRNIHTSALALAALLLVGCGSGGLGDIFGGGSSSDTSGRAVDELRGTVRYVDTRDNFIEVEDASYGYRLREGEERTRLYFDSSTRVVHEGRSYEPTALEPGDRIVADVREVGGRLLAREIDVVYDVSGSGTTRPDDRYDDDRYDDVRSELRGTVRLVDTRDRFIELERVDYIRGFSRGSTGYGDVVRVHYDSGTRVLYEGREYGPENLERGDRIEIMATRRNGVLIAEDVRVLYDVRAGGG